MNNQIKQNETMPIQVLDIDIEGAIQFTHTRGMVMGAGSHVPKILPSILTDIKLYLEHGHTCLDAVDMAWAPFADDVPFNAIEKNIMATAFLDILEHTDLDILAKVKPELKKMQSVNSITMADLNQMVSRKRGEELQI